jgi:phospholipid/cholesterol/gamma-HCH transport system substrate-binding protein
MESRAHAIAAGLFTVLLAIGVAVAVWWLSGKHEARQDLVLVSTRSVTGLNVQAQVRYRGMRAGKVQVIELNPDNPREILVRVSIPENIPVTTSTVARLGQQGLTGISTVQLDDDGSGEPIKTGDGPPPRIPLAASQFETLGSAAADIAAQMRGLVERVNLVLSDGNLERLSQIMANMERASDGLDGALKEVPPVVAELKRVLAEVDLKRLQSVLANLDRASGEAQPLIAELRGLVGNLQSVARRVESVSADAGTEVVGTTLPRMNQLLEDLSLNSRQLARVLDEVEQSPQVLLFGRVPPRPGPGEAGFVAERK